MKAINILLIVLSLAFASVSVTGCLGKKDKAENNTMMEEAGDSTEDMMEGAEESMDDAGDAMGDAMEDAGDSMEDTTDEM